MKKFMCYILRSIKSRKTHFLPILSALLISITLLAGKDKNFEKNAFNKEVFLTRETIAEEYFYNSKFKEAEEKYDELYNSTGNPIWILKKAEIYSLLGNYHQSREYILKAKDKIEKLKDSSVSAKDNSFILKELEFINYVVFLNFINRDYKIALLEGERYIFEYKDYKPLIKTMIAVYTANNEHKIAEELLKSYPLDKDSAYDVAEYGMLNVFFDRWEDGIKYLKNAWEINNEEHKIMDAVSQIATYDSEKLIKVIISLKECFPQERVYSLWLAKLYSMKDETAYNAIALLEEIKNEFNDSFNYNLIKINALQKLKEKSESEMLINGMLSVSEKDYRVYHSAAWYYFNEKDYEKASDYAHKSKELNKSYNDNYAFLIPEILKSQGRSFEARPYFINALCKEPYNYYIILNIASYHWKGERNSEKALEYYRLAEALRPEDGEIKYQMAFIYINIQAYDKAAELLKNCIDIDESVPKYHRSLGTIYMTQGNHDEGIKEIRYAYEADKSDILNLNNAGVYYITVEENLERGLYNLKSAYGRIDNSTEQYVAQTIKENYSKAKTLYEKYISYDSEEILTLPDFQLFY
ncbi:tetratricopeptide repeat protein [Clostridium polynesiense]|uniref:tetratricopeptide repeat protein n=1 Tax=Clostridium polynesiense TaxID=1325933 RepID=UPI00058F4FB7|nr:hypothetical protein [Clostridium polynesiense]